MQWYDLPRDILLPILDQLDVDDLSNLEHTSGRGRQVVSVYHTSTPWDDALLRYIFWGRWQTWAGQTCFLAHECII